MGYSVRPLEARRPLSPTARRSRAAPVLTLVSSRVRSSARRRKPPRRLRRLLRRRRKLASPKAAAAARRSRGAGMSADSAMRQRSGNDMDIHYIVTADHQQCRRSLLPHTSKKNPDCGYDFIFKFFLSLFHKLPLTPNNSLPSPFFLVLALSRTPLSPIAAVPQSSDGFPRHPARRGRWCGPAPRRETWCDSRTAAVLHAHSTAHAHARRWHWYHRSRTHPPSWELLSSWEA